ncbi:MAG: class D beta-lactamase [Candidatus Kapabacteria bacterium]|nr:class D beta-lactamase [Candidatus Kapabacteria bacterium]
MSIIKKLTILLITGVIGLAGCNQDPKIEIREDFNKYYHQNNIEGSFILFNQRENTYIYCNKDQSIQSYTPASTFKICNSLIGLETKVIENEHHIFRWDGIVRNPVWDKDHDLKSAFANSTVWYYQKLARRVGEQQMKYWVEKAKYGNGSIAGGLDQFWLSGGLRITPEQQIDFLQRLHRNEIPFSKRSTDIVKNIMIVKDTLNYVIRGKTGWGAQDSIDVGWYVGYVETKDNVYYFANCIQTKSNRLNDIQYAIQFDTARTSIVNNILNKLSIIKE